MATTLSLPAAALPGLSALPSQRWLEVVSHTDPRYGGLSSAVPALAASIADRRGKDIALAAFCLPGEQHLPAAFAGKDVSFWPTSRLQWWRDTPTRAAFAQAVDQADGLHVHGLWEQSTAVACQVARRRGKPYLLSAHGMLEPWALAAKKWKKRVYATLIERANVRGAACLHALTTAEAAQYRAFGATAPIAVVPNAVELPAQVNRQLFLERWPELEGKTLVLFLSRLHPKKGLDLLVQAWAERVNDHPEAHLVIAGPDSDGMQAKLTAQAVAAGIADRLTFTGMLSGAMKWSALAAASCYVLPSHSEGLSMALLEAMGMGLPVIATKACNMDGIRTAQAGWEIEDNAAALASALSDFFRRSAVENEATGRNGAELIAARYTPAQVARQMAEVYDFVLGGPEPQHVSLQKGGTR